MVKLDIVANSGNDEFYTPKYAITPILEFLKPNSCVWCPFDTSQSLFVKELEKAGHKVIYTHLDMDIDFFENTLTSKYLDECDYIISNPPYSLKTEVLKHLFYLKKPFAMLVGVVGIFESQKRFEMFKDNEFEILYFNRRIDYFKSFNEIKPSKNPPFSSVYICHNMLPKQIMFREINKKDLQ
jgi:hypothetical protein